MDGRKKEGSKEGKKASKFTYWIMENLCWKEDLLKSVSIWKCSILKARSGIITVKNYCLCLTPKRIIFPSFLWCSEVSVPWLSSRSWDSLGLCPLLTSNSQNWDILWRTSTAEICEAHSFAFIFVKGFGIALQPLLNLQLSQLFIKKRYSVSIILDRYNFFDFKNIIYNT